MNMIMRPAAKFDSAAPGRYTSCWATQICIAVLIAYPIDGGIVFAFGGVQKVFINQIQSSASVSDKCVLFVEPHTTLGHNLFSRF